MTTTERSAPSMESFMALGQDVSSEVVPPTYLREGEAIVKPGEGDPSGMSVSALRYKGYVQVWDTQTGVESLQPWWLLWQTMRKVRPDGSPVFTRTNPHIPINYGADLFCPLNPEAPDYQEFSGMGFKACRKRHIPHQDARLQHVRKSHKRAWDAMERAERDRIRNEDRELQREAIRTQQEFMARMMERSTQDVVQAPTRPSSPVPPTSPAPKPPRVEVSETCPDCDFVASSTHKVAIVNKMKKHRRDAHAGI